MLGERSKQSQVFGKRTVCTWSTWVVIASMVYWPRCGASCFETPPFAVLYCADGRDSVHAQPAGYRFAVQAHDRVSDAEAKARADFDLRWKVALGMARRRIRPFVQEYAASVSCQILHDKVREVFEHSVKLARESAYLKGVQTHEEWPLTRPTS